jgi:ankyrin repeat protein
MPLTLQVALLIIRAIVEGRTESINALLAAGADIDGPDSIGRTPLYLAA